MVRESARENYTGVSLPVNLMEAVDKYIEDHKELSYTSRAEFIKEAIRCRIK